ncbi:uncharacterized protein F5147DRAFT_655498 [Suillus discolor]|uniref:Uncharacterized protein n=1 Tax=Suillus discolor TaxID=1912936 RepID=A0A9P7F1F7_9AGAM|nr:uncharacterized protein F5147DRAFT_655498 [Suillus discolor]KAG2100710.1 hypothetical protein F5147DRAFT_655498 [Suillus discolor]
MSVHQGEDRSDEFLPEGSDYNDAEQGESNDNADKLPVALYTQEDKDHISPAPPARRAKGKEREMPSCADDEDLDDGQHQVDLDENPGDPLMSGQHPQEAIDKAITLGEKIVAEAEKIAKDMVQDASNISTNNWKQTQRDHWLKHCNQSENPELWKEIHKFWEGTSRNTDQSSKALYSCIMAVRDAFALSCQVYLRLEDIYVGGIHIIHRYNHINDTASLLSFTYTLGPKFNTELLSPIMMLEKFAIEGVGILHEVKNRALNTMWSLLALNIWN